MVNVSKIRSLSADKGIKLAFIIEQLGLKSRTYFQDLEKRHGDISDERLLLISELLGTSPEYLRDETDDPSPKQKKPAFIDDELWNQIEKNPKALELLKMLLKMSPEQMDAIEKVIGREEKNRT